MKYLYTILLAVCFFGCREKKSGIIIIDDAVLLTDTPRLINVDTTHFLIMSDSLRLGRLITIDNWMFTLYDSVGRVATKDSSGWYFYSDCSGVVETFYQHFKLINSQHIERVREKDSIINELLLIKANKAAYHYANNQ